MPGFIAGSQPGIHLHHRFLDGLVQPAECFLPCDGLVDFIFDRRPHPTPVQTTTSLAQPP